MNVFLDSTIIDSSEELYPDQGLYRNICGPYEDLHDCIQRYTNLRTTNDDIDGSQDKRKVQDLHKTPSIIDNFDLSPLLELCPSGPEQLQCMKHYLAQLFQQVLGDPDEADPRTQKRSLRVLCPSYVNRLVCFEQYMTFWVSMVRRDRSNIKRMYFGPGKRSSSSLYNSGTADDYTEDDMDSDDVIRDFNQKRKKSLCSSATDNLSCFEQYLSIYAKIKTGNGSPNQNRFVGKRSTIVPASLVRQVCKEYLGPQRQACYRYILRRLITMKNNQSNSLVNNVN